MAIAKIMENDVNRDIKIRSSLSVALIISILCIFFVKITLETYSDSWTQEETVAVGAFNLLCILIAFYFLFRLKTPLLIIGKSGILLPTCGLIPWGEISKLEFETHRLGSGLLALRVVSLVCYVPGALCPQIKKQRLINRLRGVTRTTQSIRINLSMSQYTYKVVSDLIRFCYLKHQKKLDHCPEYSDLIGLEPAVLVHSLVKRHRKIRMSLRITFFITLGIFFLAAASGYLKP